MTMVPESTLRRGAGAPRIAFLYPETPGLVSVIVPSYNRAGFIAATLDSVLAQTYAHVEIVVADDGSTDETRAVVAPYVARDGARVRYVQQANAGLPAARNLGLRYARGEFVALLDSDDLFEPWKLEAQLAVFRRHPTVGLVCSDMAAIGLDERPLRPRFLREMYHAYAHVRVEEWMQRAGTLAELMPGAPAELAGAPYWVGDVFAPMFLGNLMHPSTEVFRRSVLERTGGFDEAFNRESEDYELSYRVASVASVALLDAPTMRYRVGGTDQLIRSTWTLARGNARIVEHWLAVARDRITLPPSVIRARHAQAHAWLGRELLDSGKPDEARRALARSLAIEPRQPGLVLRWLATLVPTRTLDVARAVKRVGRRAVARLA